MISKPYIETNFISDNELDLLLDFSINANQVFAECSNHCPEPRWKNRTAYLSHIHPHYPEVYDAVLGINARVHSLICELHGTELHTEKLQFSRWMPGDCLDPPHADNVEPDGVTPNASPWRTYGVVLYLNNDFEGGELFYPGFDLTVKPEAKMIAVHGAGIEFTHGVKEVKQGNRHTIITFASDQTDHYQQNPHAFYI